MFLVFGNATVDLFVSGFDTIPTVDGDEFTNNSLIFTRQPLTVSIGGNGGNAAYVLGHFGAPTALCSAIGRDTMGALFVQWLTQQGVILDGLRQYEDDGTPTSTVLADTHMNRLTFHYGQPTFRYSYADIPPHLIDAADVVLLSSFSLLDKLRHDGYQRLLESAHRNGAITAVDIGPMLGEPARVDELRPLLPYITYFICNAYELQVCTGNDNPDDGCEMLLREGARCVVLKRGKDGVSIWTPDERLNVAGFNVNAATTTVGAGDSFNAGFLYALRRGDAMAQAATFGNATAALVVSSGRGVLGAPDVEAVQALIETQPVHVERWTRGA